MPKQIIVCLVSLLAAVSTAFAENAVTAGELYTEPPTLICLGFQWEIGGDDNRNATVEVSYRQPGESAWREALPLMRIGGERVFNQGVSLDYTVPRMFAGSIMDLEPGTRYECRLVLRDPDGVRGEAERTVSLATRTEPREHEGGRRLHVYPPGWRGERTEPSFTGLMEAYQDAGGGDWAVVSERKVRPGDVILVHAGLYRADYLSYSNRLQIPFTGTYSLTARGARDKPVTIRAAGDGEVIFDGNGCHRLFDVMAADWHIFEGLTIRNCDIAFQAGTKDVAGCSGLAVKNCRFEDVGVAVVTEYAGSREFYIADNTMLGRDDPHRLVGWYDPGIYGESKLKSYYAVKVYGQGHVVCHNRIAWFHDGVCISTYGAPPGERDLRASAIDFYNNDIHLMTDDFIEADGGAHNIRILRNRCFNAAQCGLSAQPVFGGPAYFIRNIVYHVPWGMAFKFEASPAGLLVYHNTICAENRKGAPHANARYRNNLLLGTGNPQRELWRIVTWTSYTTSDYNGFCPNQGARAQFIWGGPPEGEIMDYSLDRGSGQGYETLEALQRATGQEAHSLLVDYGIFRSAGPPLPDEPHAVYSAEDFDFRLAVGAAALDRGVRLPNVNDSYNGSGPDLGALEQGEELPVYGPRE